MVDKDYKKVTEQLVLWIRDKINEAGCDGAVVGLSGGVDSSVTALLCKRAVPDKTLGVIMPCRSNPQDKEDAQLLASAFDIEYKFINLEETYLTLLNSLGVSSEDGLAVANIKPRLRMTTLYYYAASCNSLVVGTDNKSELKLGYFTKFGDGGIDLAPLGDLVKSEVREIAKVLGVPDKIIEKAPSAGLWDGQTDESELGISYDQVDEYILTGKGEKKVKDVVDSLATKNEHKLKLPPIPRF
ncbi:NAD+ synthase [Halonatronum saccharophilum]|uniref:NAD+ synthase n=1 Tax=Halonatronum saccharophilum TaxID=150060 RepID=UPI000481F6FE|nr:NAD+ synthase [Halonatronum saccharophilum]